MLEPKNSSNSSFISLTPDPVVEQKFEDPLDEADEVTDAILCSNTRPIARSTP